MRLFARLTKPKKRAAYLAAFLALLAVECVIALWVRDRFVRPYLGDVLVTWTVYAFIRVCLPDQYPFLPAAIFLFCLGAVLLQLFPLLAWLGLESPFWRILLGATFDWADVACYFAGCLLLGIWEWRLRRR